MAQDSGVMWHGWIKKKKKKGNRFQYWQDMVWIVLMNEEEEIKEIRSWYIWLHLLSRLLFKRTVNISSVIPVMNSAPPPCGPHASCSSVTLLPASRLLLFLLLLFIVVFLPLSLAVVVSWNRLQCSCAIPLVSVLAFGSAPLNWCWAAQNQWA